VVAGLGLVLLIAALVAAAGPYRQTRQFRTVAACQAKGENCFAGEQGFIRAKRSWTTSTTQTDAGGNPSTTTTEHYGVTWQRADGTRESREVSRAFYRRAEPDAAATFRLFRGEVVGVRVAGGSEWFLPAAGRALTWWLGLAWSGMGLVLAGLFALWGGAIETAIRATAWLCAGAALIGTATSTLAFGPHFGVWDIVIPVLVLAFSAGMLVLSLSDRPRRLGPWSRPSRAAGRRR
jgi:hypothetical protein